MTRQQLHPLVSYVALTQGVPPELVLSRTRRSEVSRVRAMVCWLLVVRNELTLSGAARLLGMDHTSVLYAVRRVEGDRALLESALDVWRELARLRARAAQSGTQEGLAL
jgi:chromosomal replication initiation ATPase DnaA